MNRSPEEIKARCKSVLGEDCIVGLVEKSSSPSAAYTMILAETQNEMKAKAGRWLAILRRDYLQDFNELISNRVKLQQQHKGDERGYEGNICEKSISPRKRRNSNVARMGKRKKGIQK